MRFAEVVGLDDIKAKLIKSSQRNHHAQLFSGPLGSGNLALALAYSSYINCENPTADDSCGSCPSCTKIDKLVHPDLHFVIPVSPTQKWKGKDVISDNFLPEWRALILKNPYVTVNDWVNHYGAEDKQVNISKEESRQIIQKLSLKAFEARHKIMLIWLPEFMHPASANAILKILEEPPSATIFLLVTCDYGRLLTTITSRTQLVNIRPFRNDEIFGYLNDIDDAIAGQIANLSEGNLSQAINLSQQESDDGGTFFSEWMRLCWQNDFEALIHSSESYHAMSKSAQKNLLIYGLNLLRSALLSGQDISDLVKSNSSDTDFVNKFGKTVTPGKIEMLSNQLSEAHYHLERNASPKITFMDLSLSINQILKS